jgi:hypothetical protein
VSGAGLATKNKKAAVARIIILVLALNLGSCMSLDYTDLMVYWTMPDAKNGIQKLFL